jgi:uncharacterized protein YjgD (DUF1641 family)
MSEPTTPPDLLPILLQISEQQAAISSQLAELIETLNKPAENSLIDELRELLEPLFSDISEIKGRLPPKADDKAPSATQQGDAPTA